ncbi:MAG: hypothetical protein R3A10_03570 [Caldilineaceae bacterium]
MDSPPTNTVLEGRFFADTVNAGVNGIAAVGADDGCYVSNALAALKDATGQGLRQRLALHRRRHLRRLSGQRGAPTPGLTRAARLHGAAGRVR